MKGNERKTKGKYKKWEENKRKNTKSKENDRGTTRRGRRTISKNTTRTRGRCPLKLGQAESEAEGHPRVRGHHTGAGVLVRRGFGGGNGRLDQADSGSPLPAAQDAGSPERRRKLTRRSALSMLSTMHAYGL